MSIVWKLFYRRKYRSAGGGRNSEEELGLDAFSGDRGLDLRRPHHGGGVQRSLHHRFEGRELHHGDYHSRNHCHRIHRTECPTVHIDRSTSVIESGEAYGINGGASDSRFSRLVQMRNGRLPDAVLQARTRLLERLGGPIRPATIDDPNDSISPNQEAEMLRVQHEPVFPYTGPVVQPENAPNSLFLSKKTSPELDWESLCTHLGEVFVDSKGSDGATKGSIECCICLERFGDGEGLILLRCTHRFHPSCLEPWVRATCSCPYCRATIHYADRG